MKATDRARLRRSLLATLQGRPAMGDGSLRVWGSEQRPPVGPSTADTLALELVQEGLATREVRPDGRAIYRPTQRTPEPPPVEASPSPTPPPASVARRVQRPEYVRPAPPSPAPVEEPVLIAGDAAPALGLHEELAETLGMDVESEWADLIDRVRLLLTEPRAAATLLELRARVAELESAASTAQGESLALVMRLDQARIALAGAQAEAERLRQEVADLRRRLETPPAEAPALSLPFVDRLTTEQRALAGCALRELAGLLLGGPSAEDVVKPRSAITPLRERVLAALTREGQTPAEISAKSGVPYNNTSSTLRHLKAMGLVVNRTYGLWRLP